MRKTVILLFTLMLPFFGAAQDQLYKTDNTKVLVKVLEVGPDDIKYKFFNEPNGPVYVESKRNVTLIIYQNGEHQVFRQTDSAPSGPPAEVQESRPARHVREFTRDDSLRCYKYVNSLSLNFLYFFNNELGVSYRREFFSSQFSIVIPMAIGISTPAVTQNVYFNTSPVRVTLNKKLFEVGFGANYYPSLSSRNNYYIGPMFRYMQYDITQEALGWPYYMIASNQSTLSRYAFSVTNGIICRTKSRLTVNVFASIGFKSDQVKDPLKDPGGQVIQTILNPMSLYFWSGFEVGFSF